MPHPVGRAGTPLASRKQVSTPRLIVFIPETSLACLSLPSQPVSNELARFLLCGHTTLHGLGAHKTLLTHGLQEMKGWFPRRCSMIQGPGEAQEVAISSLCQSLLSEATPSYSHNLLRTVHGIPKRSLKLRALFSEPPHLRNQFTTPNDLDNKKAELSPSKKVEKWSGSVAAEGPVAGKAW